MTASEAFHRWRDNTKLPWPVWGAARVAFLAGWAARTGTLAQAWEQGRDHGRDNSRDGFCLCTNEWSESDQCVNPYRAT